MASSLERLAARYSLPDDGPARLGRILELQAHDPTASTTVREPRLAVDRHVADSLVALELASVSDAQRIADLGSGAGWPGLALAAARPAAHVSLVESAIRHCRYLRRAVEMGGLENVSVVHSRAEEWRDGRCIHDLVTARALAALGVVLEYAAPLLRDGGHVVAWKGALEHGEEADAAAAAEQLGLTHVETVDVGDRVGARDRVLVVYRKDGPTPARFPRRAGMAAKRPLRSSGTS